MYSLKVTDLEKLGWEWLSGSWHCGGYLLEMHGDFLEISTMHEDIVHDNYYRWQEPVFEGKIKSVKALKRKMIKLGISKPRFFILSDSLFVNHATIQRKTFYCVGIDSYDGNSKSIGVN